MSINWKRFTLAALLLASLALLLSGCSDYKAQSVQPNAATKAISGIVSDPATGLPVSGASVTAYGVDAGGAQSSNPISIYPSTATTSKRGGYTLQIPADYAGSVVIEASLPASSILKQLAQLASGSGGRKIRSALASSVVAQGSIPPVMVSFATEVAVEFVKQNYASGGLTSDNIRKANGALAAVFGANFAQTAPPASATDTNTSKSQQDLLVSIQAVNTVLSGNSGNTVASMVSAMLSSNGMGTLADSIKSGIVQATVTLTAAGSLPAEYQPSPAINTALSNAQSAPVAVPDVSDSTPPSAPALLTANAVSARSVKLTWSASSDDTGVTGYSICRADASGVYATIDTVNAAGSTASSFGYQDVFALPQTSYSYKVVAFDKAGNFSAASPAAAVSTPAAVDGIAPSAPAGLACKGVTQNLVSLQWLQSTKNNADGSISPAASYNVYRDYQLIATVSETSFADKSVAAGTSYSYFVKAADANGNLSASSSLLTIRSEAPAASTPPQAPGALALAAPAAYNKVSLSWGASSTAAVTYNVYRDSQLIATGIAGSSYSDSAVTPNTSYLYTVTAAAASGESAPSNQLAAATPADPSQGVNNSAPTVPANLVAVSVTSSSVSLMWGSSTNIGSDVAGYVVLRGDGSGNNMVKIATVRMPGFTDTTVSPSTVYSYRVRAFSSAGILSDLSTTWAVPTPAAVDLTDTTPPTVPGGLALATAPTSGKVALTWSASSKSTGDKVVAGYLVYRDGAQVANVKSGVTFTDTSVAGNTGYLYTVKAYDNPGNLSAASAPLSVTTPAAAPNTYSIYGKVTLNGSGLSGVLITLANGSASSTALTDLNGNYSFTGVANGSYTLSASAAGYYLFTPTSRSLTVSGMNVTGQDFLTTLSAAISGGVTYPDGTVIGGITYPGGGTVLGGVLYPTGSVIGGITYPNGVVIGGVSYPPGTVVGGIAFPVGAVTTGFSYPTGTVIGGVIYPSGTVTGGTLYPSGTVSGGVSYPTGVVAGGIAFPSGMVTAGSIYPTGRISGGISFPTGSISGSLAWQ
ncbi:carboxypeptidase regulatory-like domain-containing protein [Geomonas sp.]|uniref:carboxypeptidase regulatory-like domain-containing protein n=1 Tax=Geomonas sp. TaxID=2651584 RepID=UPI002B4A5BD8|nr:carboxypeptidase regulatory-like domain-containing protein [Geomonas sp.]HJV35704.1 carboxypeptidase regulatory-like domain-containing protein [Geomonas sp.]